MTKRHFLAYVTSFLVKKVNREAGQMLELIAPIVFRHCVLKISKQKETSFGKLDSFLGRTDILAQGFLETCLQSHI